ncbi:hypothetical protein Q0Z83_026270 [Actinoplanes sichuanensis]|nr:hypothetical protein Q0Z83_026270 [Actinoplanes sichuanensis]
MARPTVVAVAVVADVAAEEPGFAAEVAVADERPPPSAAASAPADAAGPGDAVLDCFRQPVIARPATSTSDVTAAARRTDGPVLDMCVPSSTTYCGYAR